MPSAAYGGDTVASPAPLANRRTFGHSSVNSASSITATAGNTSFRSPGSMSMSTSSASTVRSPAPNHNRSNSNHNLKASTTSNVSTTSSQQTSTHLAPPYPLLGTSPGSSSATASTSTVSATPSVNASPTPPGRQRSQSSASTGGAAQLAAERASQWLAALAPRGEGRSREFITSTLSGVATVASTVGQEVNGFIKSGGGGGHSRQGSFVGSPPEARVRANSRTSRQDSFLTVVHQATAAANGTPPPPGTASPPPSGSGSAAANAAGTTANNSRQIARPANMSRLGGGTSHQSSHSTTSLNYNLASPITSPVGTGFVRSSTLPSPPGPPASSPAPHPAQPGSPNSGPGNSASGKSGHARRGSHQSAQSVHLPSHVRSSSTGAIGLGASAGVSSALVRAAGMPYKIGFQPSGVRHDRSAEFLMERQFRAGDREKEEGRLGRRWAKLVDLHFNPATQTRPMPALPQPGTQRKTSLLSMDFDAINPKEVWKGLKMAAGPNPEEARKRAAEQTIVKWEDDADVRKCRICAVGFSLSTRKHHCRLCGRIVCSLPPTPPTLLAVQMQVFGSGDGAENEDPSLPAGTRREKCSLLLVADYRSGRGEEVDEGFVGWMSLDDGDRAASDPTSAFRAKRGGPRPPPLQTHTRRSSASSSLHSGTTTPLPQQPQEVQVKGVRVCRDCWAVVSRKQTMTDRTRVTPFQRLYVALRSLQADIENQLPDFDAELLSVKAKLEQNLDEHPEDMDLSDLVTQHKHLIALLAQYDMVAKRIAALPCAEGGSQATVQGTMARGAATFLARAMVQVHQVPKLERALAAAKARHMVVVETRLPDVLRAEGVQDDRAEEVARQLQPLLEQQAQLESYIAEANAQRKYDDSRSLGVALAEIEAEIGRLTASALDD